MPPQGGPPGSAFPLLPDLAIVILVAGVVTLLCYRLRLPVIFGYLIAGIIVGPFTPPFSLVTQIDVVNALADLGIILLLFSMGMQFSFFRLRQVGPGIVLAGILEVLLPFALIYQVARLMGMGLTQAVFLAAALSFTSTAIISKVLADQHKLNEPFTRVVFGMSVLDDLMAIGFLALASTLSATGRADLTAVGNTAINLVLFGAISLALGTAVVPRLLTYVRRSGSSELLLMVVLGLGFGMALLALKLGLSVAVGAFIMGSVIAGSPHTEVIQRTVRPVRDLFAALFFVAVGMLVAPALVVQHWPLVVLFGALFIVSKVLASALGVFLGGFGVETAIRSGLGMVAVGEFAFLIAKLGQDVGVANSFLYPVVATISLTTALVLPHLVRASDAVCEGWERKVPARLRAFVLAAESVLDRVRKATRGRDPTAVAAQRSLGAIFINMLLLGLLGVVVRVLLEERDTIARMLGLGSESVALATVGVGILALPPAYALVRHVRSFLRAGVELLMRRRGREPVSERRFFHRFLLDAVLVALALALGSLFLPIVSYSADFTQFAPFVLVGLVLGIVVYVVVDAFRLVHQRLERLFWLALVGEEEREEDSGDAKGGPGPS